MITEQEAICKAKTVVEKWYGGDPRSWLESDWVDSYESRGNGARLLVWEGSPPKGYVVVIPYAVIALSVDGGKKRVFNCSYDRELKESTC